MQIETLKPIVSRELSLIEENTVKIIYEAYEKPKVTKTKDFVFLL
jgi:hypothetical protein